MQSPKQDIRALSLDEIMPIFVSLGQQKFRAKQVYEWLWKKSAHSFDEMTNLSKELRETLNNNFAINNVIVEKKQVSNDGTIKSRFQLHDNYFVEGVLIPDGERMTACVSSQVGCSLACTFCATGKMDRMRNLHAAEIYDQVVHIRNQALQHHGRPLSNIVFMGMGEPLLNYKNVMAGIEKITSPDGLGMAASRITVSTAGVAKMIKKLGDDAARFNLALSLHAASDEKRDKIMNVNETNNLEILGEALRYFYQKTGSRITFEYIVFDNFNDSLEDAENLYQFSRNVPCKINLIEYNPIGDGMYENASIAKIDQFQQFLQSRGVIVTVRRSRGKDIDAACGQLANKE
ncbi:MAG: 23S rRNA (adenine(2503)-C(2))-methyltransferase RlmN [Bacteroidetes bacterium]|nr:23S rRNA (adenine(2503)-C(2))-methyltransferase RlmN [Bacteroidota bacterium]